MAQDAFARVTVLLNKPVGYVSAQAEPGYRPALSLIKAEAHFSGDRSPLRPAEVGWQNRDQLRFILRQGKKRQIRRGCELVGLEVAGLKRIRIGRVLLGDLPVGQWRYLRLDERF